MSDRLKQLKERSQKRRQLLAQQLGVSSPENLRSVLSSKEDQKEAESIKRKEVPVPDSGPDSKKPFAEEDDSVETLDTSRGINPLEDELFQENLGEEEIYTDSSTFLKGTQSANPHNDYCQHFVDTGERPQNFIHDVGLANRFEEYPKLRELIRLKDELIATSSTPPTYMKCDLEQFDMRELDCKFDVILVEPPLEEYQRTQGASSERYWSWDEIESLEIEQVAAQRSFLWIWCGSSDGLDAGRRCLKKWGFRRCEDICWIKTNIKNPGHNKNLENKAVFQRTKEHCLMGIRGTVRRSRDGDFIHANVDIDLIIDEEKPYGSKEKPIEIFHMIEHFCLGRRRLHVFGRDTAIRPGWLTIGPELTSTNFDADVYNGYFNKEPNGHMTGCSEEINRLRPKSPPPKVKGGPNQQGGRGGPRGGNRGGQQSRGGPSYRGGASRGGMASRGMPSRGRGQGWSGRGGPSRGYGGRSRGGHREGPQR